MTHRSFFQRFPSKLASLAALALAVFSFSPRAKAGVVGVVNKDVITDSELLDLAYDDEKSARSQLTGDELSRKLSDIRKAAIGKIVDRLLILQEAKKRELQIPDSLVDARIQKVIDEHYGGDRQALMKKLSGVPFNRYREKVRDQMSIEQMRRDVVAGKVDISEAQIESYYQQHPTPGKTLKEMHDEIEKTLKENESQRLQEEWLKTLRAAAYIKIFWQPGDGYHF